MIDDPCPAVLPSACCCRRALLRADGQGSLPDGGSAGNSQPVWVLFDLGSSVARQAEAKPTIAESRGDGQDTGRR